MENQSNVLDIKNIGVKKKRGGSLFKLSAIASLLTIGSVTYAIPITSPYVSDTSNEYTKTIKKGWSLISLPDDFSLNSQSYKALWSYSQGKWSGYSPDNEMYKKMSEKVDLISTIDDNKAYWIFVDEDIELTYKNDGETSFNLEDKNITNGWNLINTTSNITDMSVFSTMNILWYYEDKKWSAYSPNITLQNVIQNNSIIGILNYIPKYSGFWVNSKDENTSINFSHESGIIQQSYTTIEEDSTSIVMKNLYVDTNGDDNISNSTDYFMPLLATKPNYNNINAFTTLEVAGLSVNEINQIFDIKLTTTDINILNSTDETILKAHLTALVIIEETIDNSSQTNLARLLSSKVLHKSLIIDLLAGITSFFENFHNQGYTTLATYQYNDFSSKSKDKIKKIKEAPSYYQATKDILKIDLNNIDTEKFMTNNSFSVEKNKREIYKRFSPLYFKSRKNYFDHKSDALKGINYLWEMVGYVDTAIDGGLNGLSQDVAKKVTYNTIEGLGIVNTISAVGIKLGDKFISMYKEIKATGNAKAVVTKEAINATIDMGIVLGSELSTSIITEQINSGTMAQYLLGLYYENNESWANVNQYLGLNSENYLSQKTFDAVNDKYYLNMNGMNLGASGIIIFDNWLVQYDPQTVINIINKVGSIVEVIYENTIPTPPTLLKKTGQTKSYADYDDGYYQTGIERSYSRDDTKQIVTDNVTKLQWQDDSDTSSKQMNWSSAIDYCSDLTLGGYSDWSLPTRKQLVSLSDYGRYNPAINPIFQNIGSNNWYSYWSSTTYAYYSSYAWRVHFDDGYQYYNGKSYDYYVRCVRAGE